MKKLPNISADTTMTDTQQTENLDDAGVQLDLVSTAELQNKTTMEKLRFILDSVKNHNIIILESGLTPDEESRLVELTMSEIDPEGFSGIEIESYPKSQKTNDGFFSKLTSLGENEPETSLTVIGPSNEMQTIHKDESLIQTLIQQ